MKKGLKSATVAFFLIIAVLPATCFSMDVKLLQAMLQRGEKVTIIDIRSQESYLAGHIDGAIHIPASIVARKPLPPVGKVVVCGDAIYRDIAEAAVAALNKKPGIQAELLEGGFGAWGAAGFAEIQPLGMKKERFHYITYGELLKASQSNQNLILVDLRRFGESNRGREQQSNGFDAAVLSDLSVRFPGREIINPEGKELRSDDGKEKISTALFSKEGRQVYVLIDRGDGTSETMARRLFGAGIRQVVILVGGEKAMQTEGRSGSKTEVTGNSF